MTSEAVTSATSVVSDLVLRDGSPLLTDSLTSSDTVDTFAALRGHFALHLRGGGVDLLARDPLGVNKLFFAIGAEGVSSSNYFVDLVRQGHAAANIWSVPSGHLVRVNAKDKTLSLEKYSKLEFADDVPALDEELPVHASRITERLQDTFASLARALSGRTLYVTLSGGLDSTTVAALTREYIGPFTAVTFVTREPGTPDEPNSDVYYARKVAQEFGVPLEVIEVHPTSLLDVLDEVLVYGQDFRDFNVHCGLVNAVLARALEGRSSGKDRPCVLTGDTMNELMADYTPVKYGSSEYYGLPELSPGRLRRFLVKGLDTGDREVGIFAHHGIDTVQPYAICADAYASLPCGFLDREGAKQELARLMMGTRIPSFIYDRPKVRAQVADSKKVGGTMAALLDRGINERALAQRFCELCGFDEPELKRWIRGGIYRFTASYPEGA